MREPVEDLVQIADSRKILETSTREQEQYTVEIAGREFLVGLGQMTQDTCGKHALLTFLTFINV